MDARHRWNARYAERPEIGEPAAFVREVAELLPTGASVVDLAGGTGRHALWLATLGHHVSLVDISAVALDAASGAARDTGVDLEALELDLEATGLPPGRTFDLVLMHYYFDRAVLRGAWDAVAPGGLLALAQPTVTNLERHERPSRRFLLDVGELATIADELAAVAPLEVLNCDEAWRPSGSHEGRLVVRRTPT